MARNFSSVYWATPSLMLAALLSGVALAIGHDLFYNSLAGTPTPSVVYKIASSEVSRQQVNLALGTLLAFLVKASLVSAVSLAYLQAALRAAQSDDKPLTLANMDVLMSALRNGLSLASFGTWWKRPFLFLIALIAWAIPFAAIATPATLTIGVGSPPPRYLNVPHAAFSGLGFLATMPLAGYFFSPYNGPSDALKRVVAATAAQGAILSVDPPAANSSWSTTFLGPSMQCHNIEGDLRREIAESMLSVLSNNCEGVPGFIAWTPPEAAPGEERLLTPFRNGSDGILTLNTCLPTSRRRNQTIPLFIAVNSWMVDDTLSHMQGIQCGKPLSNVADNSIDLAAASLTLFRCDVFNSTYHADFTFPDGAQLVDINVTNVKTSPMSTLSRVRVLTDERDSNKVVSTCDSLQPSNGLPGEGGGYSDTYDGSCLFGSSLLSLLSYQATMDAFSQLITGRVRMTASNAEGNGKELYVRFDSNSSIASTILSTAPELEFLTSENRDRLWLIYGLAIGLSTLVVAVGLLMVALNGISYSDSFTTILRLAKGADLSVEINEADLDGRDPLPKYLKAATIKFQKGTGDTAVFNAGSDTDQDSEGRRLVRV
ncbi:hypothetical protein Neosp_003070 [[Neocosmospora] mangrovei]